MTVNKYCEYVNFYKTKNKPLTKKQCCKTNLTSELIKTYIFLIQDSQTKIVDNIATAL